MDVKNMNVKVNYVLLQTSRLRRGSRDVEVLFL